MWYIAILLRQFGGEGIFEEILETNINKLKARYPDKFSSELAMNRDLDKERNILESAERTNKDLNYPMYTAITAVSRNNIIGIGPNIPWINRTDLVKFKNTTVGHIVIMGRKTFASMGRGLPNRLCIVITSSDLYDENDFGKDVKFVKSKQEANEIAQEYVHIGLYPSEVFVIGGAQIYDLYNGSYSKILLSIMDLEIPDSDEAVYLPFITSGDYEMTSSVDIAQSVGDDCSFELREYERT